MKQLTPAVLIFAASLLCGQDGGMRGDAFTPAQLDDLVAPIALYPDPLLSQILVASTYPLELVQAAQWLQRNPSLNGSALAQGAEDRNWDPSVQALVVFPDLVKRLIEDINWTTNLGNAFLAQQGEVMDAVQRMRLRAEQAGRLPSTSQQIVSTNDNDGHRYIQIEPADPYSIYLPDYNPAYIWGASTYYPYASWYYPRSLGIGGTFISFGLRIQIGSYYGGGWSGWGNWGWHPGWRQRTIIINNNFINRHNYNQNRSGKLNGPSNWSHDSSHRQGVPYSNPALNNRYGSGVRQNLQQRVPVPQAPNPSGNSQQGAERMGNRQIAPNANSGNRNVFGGVREGGAARTHSDQGYSSLGPARSGVTAAPNRGQPAAPQNRGGGAAPRSEQPQNRGGNPGAPRGEGGGNRGGGNPRPQVKQ